MKDATKFSPITHLKPHYIVDIKGEKTAVVLDIASYENFLEEVEDLYLGLLASKAIAEDDEIVPHDAAKKVLDIKK